MTEERSKRREFLPLVFIDNCFKKPLLLMTCNVSIPSKYLTQAKDERKLSLTRTQSV